MRFRSILVHSVAVATIVLAAPATVPVLSIGSSAQAATKIAVSIGTFYDDLAPYGDWVSYEGAYVFVPADRPARWRPYTVGHWAYTERYGWLWVSEEPFGWATYHYGRWGYAEDIGWYWVPGRRWAPAWVSWRRSADHVVWAPLPPGRGNDVTVEIAIEDIPDVYWVAVPTRHFLDADVSVVVVNDDRERVRLVEAAKPAGNVTVENNIVVNNVIDIDYVEKQTQQKVKPVTVKETDDPKQAGKGGEGEVAIFNSEVKEEGETKPKDVKDVEAVKQKQTQKKEQAPQDQAPGATSEPSNIQKGQPTSPTEDQEQPGNKKKETTEEPAQPGATQPEPDQQQPVKKKGKATEEPAQPEATQPEPDQQQPVKKKGKATEQPAEPEATQPEPDQEQPVKKKKKSTSEPAQPEEIQPQGSQAQPGAEEPTQGKKKKKGAEPEPGVAPEEPPTGCEPGSEGCPQ